MQHDASTGPGAAAIGASLQLGSMEEGGLSRTFAPKIGSKNGRFFIFHNAERCDRTVSSTVLVQFRT